MENSNIPGKIGHTGLSLISSEDLIAELIKRHDTFVCGGILFKSQMNYNLTRRWHGNRIACLGLLSSIESVINDQENKSLGPLVE